MQCYTIRVKTGDRKDAGTDANVKIRLYDDQGNGTEDITLDVLFRDDFEAGQLDTFNITGKTFSSTKIQTIGLSRDDAGNWYKSANWYVEHVEVEVDETREVFVFPIHRWIKAGRLYKIQEYDVVLPQHDPHMEQREFELAEKKKIYEYEQKIPGFPVQVKLLPEDEHFSNDYKWDLDSTEKQLIYGAGFKKLWSTFKPFEKLEDLNDVFSQTGWPWGVQIPKCMHHWKEDRWFGFQRIGGCNPALIKLCTAIPEKFEVTPDMVAPFLEGLTLDQAMERKRIFIVDLKLMEDLSCKEGYVICAPFALFYVNNDKILLPIAIQLNQEKGPDNPVFLPSDDEHLWLLAKMWYNTAEATHHQALSHLSFTHMKMEGVCVCTHRTLSPSHPIFKLLAPHFLYLIAIDWRALTFLMSPGGNIDTIMACGVMGLLPFVAKTADGWRLDRDVDLENDLKNRGLDDPEVLPDYPYRDDALPVWNAIKTYVRKIVNLFYASDDVVKSDSELQTWAHEMVAPYPEGIGFKGVPGNGKLDNKEDLIANMTSIIFSCSAIHAAVNFPLYDQSAFVPNYPGQLNGLPPKDKKPRTEADIMKCVPGRNSVFSSIHVARLLGIRGCQRLGDFEVKYLHTPEASNAAQEMMDELQEISHDNKEKNKTRHYSYDVLDPEFIPNSISI